MTVFETWKPEETYELGKKMGEEAVPGQVICLNGDLGVGKTVFTQGFAAGLGIEGPVNSPTFTIVQQYGDRCNRIRRCLYGRIHLWISQGI